MNKKYVTKIMKLYIILNKNYFSTYLQTYIRVFYFEFFSEN